MEDTKLIVVQMTDYNKTNTEQPLEEIEMPEKTRARRNELYEKRTESEKLFEEACKQVPSITIVPQQPFYIFEREAYADFYIPQIKLIVEIDGEYHSCKDQKNNDKDRDYKFEHYAHIKILRIPNTDVESKIGINFVVHLLDEWCKKKRVYSDLCSRIVYLIDEKIKSISSKIGDFYIPTNTDNRDTVNRLYYLRLLISYNQYLTFFLDALSKKENLTLDDLECLFTSFCCDKEFEQFNDAYKSILKKNSEEEMK